MATKSIKYLELHYTMIQFLVICNIVIKDKVYVDVDTTPSNKYYKKRCPDHREQYESVSL